MYTLTGLDRRVLFFIGLRFGGTDEAVTVTADVWKYFGYLNTTDAADIDKRKYKDL